MNWSVAECGPAGTYHDLVEEVLDKLLLERSGGKESVEVGAQKLSDEIARAASAKGTREDVFFSSGHGVHVFQRGDENVAQRNNLRYSQLGRLTCASGQCITFS